MPEYRPIQVRADYVYISEQIASFYTTVEPAIAIKPSPVVQLSSWCLQNSSTESYLSG